MNWNEILPPPKGVANGSYLTAVTQVDDELVGVIDVEKILKEIIGGSEDVTEGIIDDQIRDEVQQVLVVDDSSVARKQVKRVLDQLGVETTLCNDGREALDQLHAWMDEGRNIDEFLSLIISDVEMPMMDGYTLTAEIRKNPALASLHVILHTSLSGVFNEAMVERVGANQFLAKYEPDELAAIVQERLKAHMTEQEAA